MSKSLNNTQIIMDSLRRIVQSIRRASNRCEQFSELTGAQFFVLKNIQSNKNLSINELAELTYTHQSTVSEVVSRLESIGLVARKKAEKDARRSELTITNKGKLKLKSSIITAQENLITAVQTLSKTESDTLAKLLIKLTKEAGLSEQKPHLFFEDK